MAKWKKESRGKRIQYKQTALTPIAFFGMAFFLLSFFGVDAGRTVKTVAVAASLLLIALSLILYFSLGKDKIRSAVTVVLIPIAAAIILSSVLSYMFIDRIQSGAEVYDGKSVTAENAVVEEVLYSSSNYSIYKIKVVFPDGEERAVALACSDFGLDVNDLVSGDIELSLPSDDEREYLLSDGIFLEGESENIQNVGHDDTFSLKGMFKSWNGFLSSVFKKYSDEDGSALSSAVLLGDKSGIAENVRRNFGRLGISHLFAISGLHLSVIAAIIHKLFGKLRIFYPLAAFLKIIPIVLFMGITGFSLSVVRAGIMHIIRLVGDGIGRESYGNSTLFAASTVIIAVDPYAVFDTGFILSVLAAFACIAYSEMSEDKKLPYSLWSYIGITVKDIFLLTLTVTAVTLPVTLKYYGTVSLLAPLANIVFIPLITLYLYISVFILAVAVIPFAAVGPGQLLGLLSRLILYLSEKAADIRNVTVSLNYPGVGILAVLLSLSVILWAFLPINRRKIGIFMTSFASLSVIAAVSVGIILSSGTSSETLVSVGVDDGFVLKNGNEYTIVDISSGSRSFMKNMTDRAEEYGATEIECLMLTHLHEKHINTLDRITSSSVVRKVVLPLPAVEEDGTAYGSILGMLEEKGIAVEAYNPAETFVYTDGEISVESEAQELFDRSEHPAVFLKIDFCDKETAYITESFAETKLSYTFAKYSDFAVFGGHPPAGRLEFNMAVNGMKTVTEGAADFIKNCDIGENAVFLTGEEKYIKLFEKN